MYRSTARYTDEALTLTGGLITDAVREADVEGDGLTPPAGVGIWPAATNIVTQSVPGALATTGVTKAGDAGATLTLVTDATAPFQASQTKVWLLDNSAGATDATVDFDGNATAAAHAGSIWAKKIAGSPTVSIEGGGTPTAISGTTDYARYSQTLTASLNDNLRITAPAGAVVRFTAGQLETGSIATSFIVTDGATASRVAGRVQQPVADLFTATQGAVFMRVNPGWGNSAEPGGGSGFPRFYSWFDDASNRIQATYNESTNQVTVARYAGGSSSTNVLALTVTKSTPFSYASAWTATGVKQAVNGGAFSTPTGNLFIPVLTATSMDIGSLSGTGSFIDSNILWYATFAGTLTDADSAALDAFGDTPPTWAQLVGALPSTALVTSLWQAVDGTFMEVS